MIRDHVFGRFNKTPWAADADACAYLSCRRPRAEHERASERGDLVQDGIAAAKAARS